MSQGYERLSEIASKMKDAVSNGLVPTPEELTVREFLGWYEYAKRGAAIVSRIRNDLEKLDLRTNPDFEVVWIDSTISIELQPDATDAPSSSEPVDPTQRIGSLEAANRKPMSVNPTDALSKATTTHIPHINPAGLAAISNGTTRCSRIAERSGYHEC